MTQEAGSKGRASGAMDSSVCDHTEVQKHVCLRYMSMSPVGGFNNVVEIEWLRGEETWQMTLKS